MANGISDGHVSSRWFVSKITNVDDAYLQTTTQEANFKRRKAQAFGNAKTSEGARARIDAKG